MKIKRSLLAVAITFAAAACSGDVAGPDSSARVPAHQSGTTPQEPATTNGSATTTTVPPEPDPGDTGSTGSGCCMGR
ncbi:hypothetical protein [Longimicrobium sp.]|uniref:hypothetical protein n=1 Tax=Longimicrobium sp. TaxID=2029185 RepID=UPI003B3A9EA4